MARYPGRTFGVLVSVLSAAAAAGQPDQLWIEQLGTSSEDAGRALAADGAGGVFFAGYTRGSLGGPNLGARDAFLARYDADGNTNWISQFGTSTEDHARALAADGAGGVFIAGTTLGSLGGPSIGGTDAFLARYDTAGEAKWITQLGTSDDDSALALAPDGAGGVFITGDTLGGLGGPNAGVTDAFLVRYDANGNVEWTIQFGTSKDDYGRAVASDGSGGVFIAGSTLGGLGGPNAGGADAFLARCDADGNTEWITQFGTSEHDYAMALAPDGAGGVFLSGNTGGDLGAPNAGTRDAYLARFDADSHMMWLTQFGTSGEENIRGLASDGSGGVFAAGYTEGSLGGPSAGSWDAFRARFDADGNTLWLTQFGSSNSDETWAAAPDSAGGAFFAGRTRGSLGGPNAGGWDAFLVRDGTVCYPDFTGDGSLDLFDFLAFVNAFNAGEARADCTGDGPLDLFDFLCFVNWFNGGC